MKLVVFLGPGSKFDARQRFGKDKPEYIFWSPTAREVPHGVQADLSGNVAPRGEAGKAREVTNEEAEDLLTFPRRAKLDFRFEEVTDEQSAVAEPEIAPSLPRSPEEIRADVARESGQDTPSKRTRTVPAARED